MSKDKYNVGEDPVIGTEVGRWAPDAFKEIEDRIADSKKKTPPNKEEKS